MSNDNDKANDDNRSDQLNPNNDTYWTDRGYDQRPDDWDDQKDDSSDSNSK